jgi:hypothetical protein
VLLPQAASLCCHHLPCQLCELGPALHQDELL